MMGLESSATYFKDEISFDTDLWQAILCQKNFTTSLVQYCIAYYYQQWKDRGIVLFAGQNIGSL